MEGALIRPWSGDLVSTTCGSGWGFRVGGETPRATAGGTDFFVPIGSKEGWGQALTKEFELLTKHKDESKVRAGNG